MRINEITVADHPDAWRSAGFTVENDRVTIGQSFVIHLTGAGDGGVSSWSLGFDGREDSESVAPGGLALDIAGSIQPAAGTAHANGVTHAMKAVILCSKTSSAVERLKAAVTDMGAPPVDGHDDKGIHYCIWPLDNTEVGLEVVCLDPAHGDDTMAALFLVVEDLDATIECIGANDVTKVEVYGGRRMTRIKPRIGVTAGIHLIARAA
tara:strand:- start:689 stop:1312 length:624 start_codon:yes stop_codon:yes gene_type:complete